MEIFEFSPLPLARLLAGRPEKHVLYEDMASGWIPNSVEEAYTVQDEIIRCRGTAIRGWKVGSPAIDGPIRCAPLPADCVSGSGAVLSQAGFTGAGLELEIAFRFSRTLTAEILPNSDAEILSLLSSIAASIELVSSRFVEWPDVPALVQLADLQNHGALIVGEFVPYASEFCFIAPKATFTFDGDSVSAKPPANPAGDPRRLLPWLVRHCVARGVPITPETIITTGTYTGMHFPRRRGKAVGSFAGLPPVEVVLA